MEKPPDRAYDCMKGRRSLKKVTCITLSVVTKSNNAHFCRFISTMWDTGMSSTPPSRTQAWCHQGCSSMACSRVLVHYYWEEGLYDTWQHSLYRTQIFTNLAAIRALQRRWTLTGPQRCSVIVIVMKSKTDVLGSVPVWRYAACWTLLEPYFQYTL